MHKSRIRLIIISAFLIVIFISLLCQAQTRDRRGATAGPVLGVGVVDLSPGTAQQGVQVQTVAPGSLADIAGIKPGDIITTLNNTAVTSMRQFMRLVAVQGNSAYPLGIVREGLPRTIMIGAGGTSVATGPAAMGPILGLVIKDIPPEWGLKGVLVQDVRPALPAALPRLLPLLPSTARPISMCSSMPSLIPRRAWSPWWEGMMRNTRPAPFLIMICSRMPWPVRIPRFRSNRRKRRAAA